MATKTTKRKPRAVLQSTPAQIRRLRGAIHNDHRPEGAYTSDEHFAALRAALYAVFPGKQNERHIAPAMEDALPEYCRALRRQARR